MKTLEQMIEAAKAVMDEYDLVNYPHEFAADFAREQIEEALSVERSRVVAAIDALRAVRNRLHLARGAKNLPVALEMVNEALRDLDEAIEIVKGGGDD